jgi:hypothetical protein
MQAIYDSPWHSPALAWLLGLLLLAAVARRVGFLLGFTILFAFEIMADALVTGGWSPLPPGSRWAQPLAITFVILGDSRYFLLLERYVRGSLARAALPAIAWSFVVPLTSQAMTRAAPHAFVDTRMVFLGYELAFAALALVLRFAVLPRRLAGTPAPIRRWLLGATTFQIVQYALWALADVVITSGHEAGFLLRLIPNTMYYGLFLPFVLFTAPDEART